MGEATQIAFQLDNESLAAVDALAAQESQSRAELLRRAVREFLTRRSEEEIEAQLAAGYGHPPPGSEADELAELSVEGLRAGHLDW
ncbi:MAG: CopG family transcriptional regulator [Pseudonocardiaceae bacterium]